MALRYSDLLLGQRPGKTRTFSIQDTLARRASAALQLLSDQVEKATGLVIKPGDWPDWTRHLVRWHAWNSPLPPEDIVEKALGYQTVDIRAEDYARLVSWMLDLTFPLAQAALMLKAGRSPEECGLEALNSLEPELRQKLDEIFNRVVNSDLRPSVKYAVLEALIPPILKSSRALQAWSSEVLGKYPLDGLDEEESD